MSKERHEIWAVADALQMDLRAASAKLVELRARISALDLPGPEQFECPKCGVRLSGPTSLAEHDYALHDGPVPPHWLLVEARSRQEPVSEEVSG